MEKHPHYGPYELIEMIGVGGMGEVWREGAIKLVRREALGPSAEGVLKRFRKEAQVTAGLSSPHTVDLFDFGESEDGTLFYAMELLNGIDAQNLVERFGPQPEGRVVHLLLQVCESLGEAHQQGVIHRDIKPANIFLCKVGLQVDFVKVLDFGLVKSLAPSPEETMLTAMNATAGTPAFMAPEIASGRAEVDARADIYCLACVAYWLLTGQQLFPKESPIQSLLAHIQEEPPAPSLVRPEEISAEMDHLLLRCLAKEPAQRPANTEEVAEALRALAERAPWEPARAREWWAAHLPEQLNGKKGPALVRSTTTDETLPGDVGQGVPLTQANPIAAASPGKGTPPTEAADPAPAAQAAPEMLPLKRGHDSALSNQRLAAIRQLRNHFAYSTIDVYELERRLEMVQAATDGAELEPAVADLPALDSNGKVPIVRPAAAVGAQPQQPQQPHALAPVAQGNAGALAANTWDSSTIAAFLTKETRQGAWKVTREITIFALLGGAELDFTQVEIPYPAVEVNLSCFMGGVKIIVPEGLYVESNAIAVAGSIDIPAAAVPPIRDMRRIHLTGMLFLGGVDVIVRPRPRALPRP